jgi:hypothetical protein
VEALKELPGWKAPVAASVCPGCRKSFKPIAFNTHKRECTGNK